MRCNRRRWCSCWLVTFALVLLTGCPETSSLTQVTGKITVDGKPASGASVLFFPQSGDTTNVAAGAANADGQYTLVSNLNPGIAPGKYKITVVWPAPAKPENKFAVMGEAKDPPDMLKGKYADPNRTQLLAEITDSTTELPPLELSTK